MEEEGTLFLSVNFVANMSLITRSQINKYIIVSKTVLESQAHNSVFLFSKLAKLKGKESHLSFAHFPCVL